MKKLLWTSFAALAAALFSMTMVSCGPDEPDPSTGSGTGNGGGGNTQPATVAVSGVSLSKTTLSLTEGGSETLTATVAPDNATNKAVSWKSSDASTATVDNSGKVTAVKAGTATITVTTTDGSKTATCSVTVTTKTVSVTGVTLDQTSLELQVDGTAKLSATVAPSDATNSAVTWNSSDSNVATVDGEGNVTAVKEGEATITVTTADGGKTATCKVTVKPVQLDGLAVNPATLEIKEGEEKQLEVVFTPENFADKSVQWASDNINVVSVSGEGLIKALKPGTAKVYVESQADKTKQAFCEVTVTPDPALKGISFPYTSLTMKKGEAKQLQVVFDPEYAENKNVTWKSSDPAVATVDDAGKVTAVWNGETTVTATSQEGGFTATCSVTVSQEADAQVYVKTAEGLFLNGEKYTGFSDNLHNIYSDGKDLYYDDYYSGLFKNGVRVSKAHDAKDLTGVAAGRVYYFDSGSISVYDMESGAHLYNNYLSDASGYRNEAMAVAADGTAYVVGYIRDAFNKYVAKLWTITKDFQVSEKTMYDGGFEETGRDVAVDSKGNVWALTRGKGLNLYKNGEFVRMIHSDPDGNHDHFISFHGDDMYIVTTKDSQKEIVVYKNDKVIYDITDEAGLIAAAKLRVLSNGDIYFGASDWENSLVYKNGKPLYTLPGWCIYSMAILE